MRYYLTDDGRTLQVTGDVGTGIFAIPPGFHEVTAEEYHAAAGTIVLAAPPADDGTAPNDGAP